MHNPPLPPYKPLREAIGLSQRAVERALGWKSGRLSTLERGLQPTDDERRVLLSFLNAKLAEQTAVPDEVA